MKVVAGKYKGFNLLSPKSKTSRPTDNKVKEAVFDMLFPYKADFTALDLFAGTGQMGIEFLSRGAKKVHFNEKNYSNFSILNQNLDKIDRSGAITSKQDFLRCLKELANKEVKFDYIFLDPPYETDFIDKSLNLIMEYDLLNEDGIVITESSMDLDFSDKYDLHILKDKSYGRKYIKFYKK
ncbi:16S rRNA (guanine(966)-N(2))-methyltransferase RsmD [uncultured Anaerococcus sp.]|uniref:16S rRNA (guanine(966)-N(2))-methyltransferase RsmD n=1 Tax=uncultured Anaerococcus sp. TaxID=293428 RepID=UPI00288B3BF3|nr:16S rRNA (guanine(966)-N(2))-methyltransferase RsmD [uncultured Anaerococcus sp.]